MKLKSLVVTMTSCGTQIENEKYKGNSVTCINLPSITMKLTLNILINMLTPAFCIGKIKFRHANLVRASQKKKNDNDNGYKMILILLKLEMFPQMAESSL